MIRDAPVFLKPGGWLALEVGAGKARYAETMFARAAAYDPVLVAADREGEPRVVYGRALESGPADVMGSTTEADV